MNSSRNQFDTSSIGDNTFNGDLNDSSLHQSALEEPSINYSSNLYIPDEEETTEIIQGFKPKIVQNQFKVKPSMNNRTLTSKPQTTVTTRNVDLKWLDDCLADGKLVNYEEPKAKEDYNEDDDIAYSSDEEPKQKTKPSLKKMTSEAAQPASQPIMAVKRKLEEEKCEPAVKKSKVEHCEAGIINDDASPLKSTELIEDNTNYLNQHEDPAVDPRKNELSSTAAKKERLAKYI